MTNNNATVTTLTASVHVLQMGARQITLSVAKQLDVVHPSDIEPFGRIRLDSRFANSNDHVIETVGVSKRNGSLVRSRVENLPEFDGACIDPSWTYDPTSDVPRSEQIRNDAPFVPRLNDNGWSDVPSNETIHAEWSELPLIALAGR